MSCKKCRNIPCSCADSAMTTTPYDTANCPTPQVCSEFIYTGCIIYNGPELVEINIVPGMTLNEIIQAQLIYLNNSPCMTTTCPAVFVNVIKITSTSIDIGWNTISEAESYLISYSDEAGSPQVWLNLPLVTNPTNHLVITGLTCESTYNIRVTANYSSSFCDSVVIRVTTSSC